MAGETGEKLDFKITVDAAQAQAEIAKFTGRISELESQLKKSDTIVDGLKSSLSDMASELATSQKAAANFEAEIAKLNTKMVDLQKQVSGAAGGGGASGGGSAGGGLPALGGASKNAGQNVLILSQAVDDAQYGLKGVINNVPQVVAAVGGSMGLAGAFGIAAVAVSLLYDRYKDYDAAQREIASNSKIWKSALDSVDIALREGVNKRTKELTQILKDAQTELRNFGKTSREISEDQAKMIVAATEQQLSTLEKNLPALQERAKSKGRRNLSALQILGIEDVFTEEEKEDLRAQNEILTKALSRRDNLIQQLADQRKDLENLLKTNKELAANEAKSSKGDSKDSEKDRRKEEEANAKWLAEAPERILKAREEADAKAEAETERNMREIVDLEQLYADQELAIYRKTEKEKTKIKKQETKERERIDQKFTDFSLATQQMLLGQLASSTSNYIQAKIEGEKDAERKAIAGFLKATGQQLVASGTRAIFEGVIANAAIPGSGVPLMTAGSAAIGAGILMGAGGAAVMPKEPPRSKEASRERGASSFSGRSSRGDGGTNLTIVYGGISGPTADQGSRALMSAWSRARRRGYA